MEKVILDYITIHKHSRDIFVSFNNLQKINVLIAEDIKRSLFDLIKMPRTNLILNMTGVTFIDSSGFEALNVISKVSHIYNSKFTLVNVSNEVMELVNLVRKFSDFGVYRIVEQEEQGFSKAG